MDRDQVKALLRALGARNVKKHGEWIQASCPLAPWEHDHGRDRNPSFAIQVVRFLKQYQPAQS